MYNCSSFYFTKLTIKAKKVVYLFFKNIIDFRLFVEIPRLIGSVMLCINTGNYVEKLLLDASLVVLEKVMVSHRQLVDQERLVGSARTPCSFTENDKPIVVKCSFVLRLYDNIVC